MTEALNTEPQDTTSGTETTPQEANHTPADTTPAPTPADPVDGQQDDKTARGKGNSEAAKYRTRLREAEAERDELRTSFDTERAQLTAQIEAAREIILNSHLEATGIKLRAEALTKLGYSPADMIGENFTINGEALETTLQEISANGFEIKAYTGVVPKSGTGSAHESPGLTWGEALNAPK